MGDRKSVMLEAWLQTHDQRSPDFVEHCGAIAADMGEPCNTSDDAQRIFNMLPSLRGFASRLTYPKLGNWYAWDKAVEEQHQEWTASLMVYKASEAMCVSDAN